MAENKTKPTAVNVTDFLNSVEHPTRRADGFKILEMMTEISGETAKMWGPSIVGFGSYHYKYDSGHEGDMCEIGFSPRKASLSLYLIVDSPKFASLLAELGKHKAGKGCLYINKLADVDEAVLRELIKETVKFLRERYK